MYSEEEEESSSEPQDPNEFKEMSAWGNKKEAFYQNEQTESDSNSEAEIEEEKEAERLMKVQAKKTSVQDFIPNIQEDDKSEDSSSDVDELYETLKAQ